MPYQKSMIDHLLDAATLAFVLLCAVAIGVGLVKHLSKKPAFAPPACALVLAHHSLAGLRAPSCKEEL